MYRIFLNIFRDYQEVKTNLRANTKKGRELLLLYYGLGILNSTGHAHATEHVMKT